jgi:hypothetical protein
MLEITSTSFNISTLTNTNFRTGSYTIPVGEWSVRKNVLLVGVVLVENGTVTVNGIVTITVLFALSEAVISSGKLCSGCASSIATSENESGLLGVRKPCGLPTVICELFGGPETLTPSCGDVPAFAVTDIWTVAVDAGVNEMVLGETWIVNGAIGETVKENVVLRDSAPLVPVTVTVVLPAGVVAAAAN